MPPLDPTTIPNLQCWWDASDPASFAYSSGTLVSQWNDKGPAARHLTHATPANQPSRSGSRAGLPTVVFDGNRLLVSSVAVPFNKSNVTIFVVACETSHPQDYSGIFIAHAGSAQDHANGLVLDVGYSGTTHFGATRNDVRSNVPSAAFPMPFAVYTALYDTSVVTGYENGVTSGASAGAASGVPAGMGMGSRYLAGVYNQTYGLRGEIAEVLIYSRTLTTIERQTVELYLKDKWVNPLVLADTVTVTDIPPVQFFVPSDLSGLKLHLDASKLTPGATYSSWPNLAAGGAGPLTAIGSPAPVVTTPQAGKNGLPVMRYTNSGGHQLTSGAGFDRDYTMVVVCRLTGGANQRFIGRSGGNFLVGYHGGSEDVAYLEGWLDGDGTGVPASTTWKLYSLDCQTSPFLPLLYKDGVVIKGTGGGAGGGWANTFSLGGEASYGGQGSNGEIAEVVVYNRKLSAVERQQVEAYLRAKWITPGLALTLGPSDGLADTVATSDSAEVGFQFAQTMPPDTVTVTDVLGLEVSITFADGVNVSDDPPILGAAHFVEPAETVTTSDLFGTQIGEYITPCTPDPIVGEFLAGQSIVGTWFACAKKGILGLGAYAPVLEIHNLAASPAGLGLGGTGALFVGQKPEIPGGGMYLGGYAPGFSLMLTPPLGALGLRTRIPLSVGLTPPIYPAGLELGGHTPKFAGKEPPVESAGLALGGIVPAFKFSQTLATPSAGLQLGGGIPVQVEEILILPVPEYPIDLLDVPEYDAPSAPVGAPSVDLLSSPSFSVTLGSVEDVPSDDLNEVECV